MNVELIESVHEFIDATADFRAADPLRTNVVGSVSMAVASGRTTYDAYHWWVVRDDHDDIVGIAMRTTPFNMNVAPMPIDAARALGRDVARFDDDLPGLAGSKDVIDALVEGYVESNSPGSRRALREDRRDLLYELEELIMPEVDGEGRPAEAHEIELLATMFLAFMEEVDIRSLSLSDARESVTKSVKEGSWFCWVVDGTVASIAGHAPIVTTGSTTIGRVGPVYTPPESRGRGFGSAVTAHVTRHLIEKGARVMLFTDAANPTSNGIYQEIGYRLVDELVEMRFDGS